MELIAADLRRASDMFAVLDNAAKVDGAAEVTLIYRAEGGERITVAYGESAEPAIVGIEEVPEPTAVVPITERTEDGFTTTCLVRLTVADPNQGAMGRYHTPENVTEWLRQLVETAPPLGVRVRVIREF